MKKIKESEVSILEWLHDYRFLTVRQMVKMGVYAQHTIYKGLQNLHRGGRKYIDWVDFGTRPERGRIDRLLYLTKHGAELLAEVLQLPINEISYPKGTVPRYKDLTHRMQTVDLHIMARTYCQAYNAEIEFFNAYFEHQGGNNSKRPDYPKRKALNTVPISKDKAFIPDCIFKIRTANGKQYLFTAEIYRNHNTKRTHNQLDNHLEAIGNKSISKLYNFPHSVQVLILCEKAGAMKALQKRLASDPAYKHTEQYFLFRTFDPVTVASQPKDPDGTTKHTKIKIKTLLDGGFSKGWQTYTGKKMVLFR